MNTVKSSNSFSSEETKPTPLIQTLDDVANLVYAKVSELLRRHRIRWILGWVFLGFVIAAHVARLGTLRARLCAWGLFVAMGVALVVDAWRLQRRTPRRWIMYAAKPLGEAEVKHLFASHDLAQRILTSPTHEGVSLQLAQLHVQRALRSLRLEQLTHFVKHKERVLQSIAWVCIAISVTLSFATPMHILEGANVALARKGQAPFKMTWLEELQVEVQPPTYVFKPKRQVDQFQFSTEQGSLVVVRGVPKQKG